jgi:hypothetical protein
VTPLEVIREDQALGAAWRRCEVALPPEWNLSVGTDRLWKGCFAVASHPTDDEDVTSGETVRWSTPTAALEALAAALEKRGARA